MSTVDKTIEIIFAGVDEVSGTIDSISTNLSNMSSGLSDISTPFSDLAKNVLIAEAALAGLAAGGIALAVTKAGEFKSGVQEVNTMLNLSSAEVSKYSDNILAYSQTSTQSLESINTALYNAASLGVSYASSLDVLAAAEKLAIGGKADLNDAMETLIGTMNAYGAPMTEITNYSDAFFTIIKDGKTTLPELSSSIASVTGIAAAAGIPFETLGAAIAAMTASGAPTAEAITKIRSAIEAIITPTPAASKVAKELGVELGEAALKSKGFPEVLKDIYDKTGGNIEKINQLIPTTEGLQAVLSLGADKAGIFAKSMVDMANNAGATELAFKTMKDNAGLIWQTMANNFETMLIELGLKVGGESTSLIKAFSDLWASISKGIDSGTFDPIIKVINDLLDDTGNAVSNLAKELPDALKGVDFTGFVTSIEVLIESLEDLFGLDFSNDDSIKDSIQKIIDGFESLTTVSAGIINALNPVVDAVMDVATWFTSLDTDTQKLIGGFLGVSIPVTAFATGLGVVATAVGGLGPLFTGVIGLLSGPVGLGVAIAAVAVALVDMFSDFEPMPEEYFTTPTDLLKQFKNEIELMPKEVQTELKAMIDNGAETQEVMKFIADQDAKNTEATFIRYEAMLEGGENVTGFIEGIPEDTPTTVTVHGETVELDQLEAKIEALKDQKLPWKVEVDQAEIEKAKNTLSVWVEGADGSMKEVSIEIDDSQVDTTKAKIAEIPAEKMLEIKMQGDIDTQIAQITAMAETAQVAFEWKAKLDIAEVEAQAEVIKSAYDSINVAIQSTGDLMATALGGIDSEDFQTKWASLDVLREETELRQKTFELQEKLTESQIRYQDAKTKALESGESVITIDSAGLEPALEMVMWEIIQKVQVRATAEASEFLLGL